MSPSAIGVELLKQHGAKSAWIMPMCLASAGGAVTPPIASAMGFSSFSRPDAIILDLDDEWTGLDEILVSIGSGDSRQVAIWDGEPMVFEHIDFPIGYLPVSVTGRTKDGSRSITTARASHVFSVPATRPAGRVDGPCSPTVWPRSSRPTPRTRRE